MNREKTKENAPTRESYLGQDVYIPASNWLIASSLMIALILNFMPLQGDWLTLRPDFVVLAIMYWSVNHPHKLGMSVAFGLGLMMDVGNAGILGQHALAYCVVVCFALVFGRRLRLFNWLQQAPQIGLICFIMQLSMELIALSSGAQAPEWSYFLSTVTVTLFWIPVSFVLALLQKQKPNPDVL